MADACTVWVDGVPVRAQSHWNLVAAIAAAGGRITRTSVAGEPRFALCGMGVCQECRVRVDGVPHLLACQLRCRDGMRIATGEGA